MPARIPRDIQNHLGTCLDDEAFVNCVARINTCTTQEDGDIFIDQLRGFLNKPKLFKLYAEGIANQLSTPENRENAEGIANQSSSPENREHAEGIENQSSTPENRENAEGIANQSSTLEENEAVKLKQVEMLLKVHNPLKTENLDIYKLLIHALKRMSSAIVAKLLKSLLHILLSLSAPKIDKYLPHGYVEKLGLLLLILRHIWMWYKENISGKQCTVDIVFDILETIM